MTLLHTRSGTSETPFPTNNMVPPTRVDCILGRSTEEVMILRDAQRFFWHLFPGVVGLWPSSLHRRIGKLRRFLEPLRRAVLAELAGDPETLVVDSTLLALLHPRQVEHSAGFDGAPWAVWGSFAVYGVRLHLLSAPPTACPSPTS